MNGLKNMLFLMSFIIIGHTVMANSEVDEMRVGIQVNPPFVFKEKGTYSGVSIDLWEKVASKLNKKYTLIEYDITELLVAIEKGDVDIAIAPLTVTSARINKFGFTQPYYITNLAYATKAEKHGGFFTLLTNIFSVGFLKAIIPLFLIISIFGFIVWLLERKKNSDQFGKGIAGVRDGIWWSAVTMSTVGYGDKSPITPYGRVIGIIWMFTAVIMISGLTASVSSSLTVHRLKTEVSNFDDLRKTKVGCIPGSGTSNLLERYKIPFKNFNTVDEGLIAVNDGSVDAFVYDDAVLSYFVQKNKFKDKIEVIPSSYSKEYFGFASSNYSLLKEVDVELLRVIESDEWEMDLKKYNIEYRN